MPKRYLTIEQQKDYDELCKARIKGRLLTMDALILICDAYHYNAEEIGKHFIDVAMTFKSERDY